MPVRFRLRAALLALVAAGPGLAQTSIVETPLYGQAEPGIGSQYRDDMKQVWAALQQGETADALRVLGKVRDYCDAQQRPGHRVVGVAGKAEYEAYMAAHGDGVPTDWIDIACPAAYHMTGYVYSGARRFDQALPWLDKAIAIAPYYPDPLNERGFVLAQQRRFDEALASYHQALALADAHPAAAYIKPLSLRGVGYVLTETGDLDGARKAYEDSLALDPGNATALNELEYIRRQRDAHAPSPPATAP